MNIYVIRHGQTPWNVERRLQGRSDTDLNEIGREMAIETGKAFQKVHFDVVFTSPLKRARETAELFLGDRKVPEHSQTPPNGESLEELGARTKAFMEDIMHRPELQDKTVLVSSHGCATRGILNSIRSFELADFWHGGVPKNCSVALIHVENGQPSLIYENRTFLEEK